MLCGLSRKNKVLPSFQRARLGWFQFKEGIASWRGGRESGAVGIPCIEPVRIGVISPAVPVPEPGSGSADPARALGAMEGVRLSWDTSLTLPTGANPQVDGERGGHGPTHSLPPPASWSCREEQDHGFGREGAKWMLFLCQAFLLPPDLAVALILSSPRTRVSGDVWKVLPSWTAKEAEVCLEPSLVLDPWHHTGELHRVPSLLQTPNFSWPRQGSTSPAGRGEVFCGGGSSSPFLCGKAAQMC